MIEIPAIGRANISENGDFLRIEIPAKKHWVLNIFMSIWLCAWFYIGKIVIKVLLNFDGPWPAFLFILFWITLWTLGGLASIYSILMQLMGVEIIQVENGTLSIEKSIRGLGRKKAYEINEISKIDHTSNYPSWDWSNQKINGIFGDRGASLKFYYGMKTVIFAIDIDEAEAQALIEKFKSHSSFNESNFA
ncbi:MAG: hypothetical protein AAF487_04265 [Bacteroidota bacterium]